MYLYHVTYLFNLPGIAEDGLLPGTGRTFQGTWYEGYAKGWLFLTEGDGVRYWMNKLEEHANANTDHPEEGWVPVVLSFEKPDDLELEEDVEGTRDSMAQAWKTRESIPPDDIEVYVGPDWIEVDEADTEEMLEEVLDNSKHIQEEYDGEEEDYWEVNFQYFRPSEEELEEDD